jgi:hypothetical protein
MMRKMQQVIRKKTIILNRINEIKRDKKKLISSNSLKCGICNTEILNRATIHRSGVYIRVICEKCLKKFSTSDIELMINLFTAFGGHYGKNKKPDYIIYILLKELKENLSKKENSLSLAELKLKLLHKALLYGVSPDKYFQGLKLIIK